LLKLFLLMVTIIHTTQLKEIATPTIKDKQYFSILLVVLCKPCH